MLPNHDLGPLNLLIQIQQTLILHHQPTRVSHRLLRNLLNIEGDLLADVAFPLGVEVVGFDHVGWEDGLGVAAQVVLQALALLGKQLYLEQGAVHDVEFAAHEGLELGD